MDNDLVAQSGGVLVASAVQLVTTGGVLLSTLAVSAFIARIMFTTLSRVFGTNSIVYTTGWLGTPVHELSHLVACWVFHLKVLEVKLFEPDYESSSLGYVRYSFNRNSIYQRIGCFFVGVAPLAGGMGLILVLGWWLVPDFNTLVVDLIEATRQESSEGITGYITRVGEACLESISVILSPSNGLSWTFWVFIYITGCISCHLTPSRSDLEGIGPGILALIVLVVIGNGIAAFLGYDPDVYNAYFGNYLGVVASLFGITLGISLVVCGIVYGIAIPARILR